MDDRLTSGISIDVPLTDEQTAQLLRRANLLSQLSNILCGKELATLEELLQGASQVKAELAAVKQERDAAVADLDKNHQCDICAHVDCQWDEYPCSSCLHSDPVDNVSSNFEWRGVCQENTEVQDGQSDA